MHNTYRYNTITWVDPSLSSVSFSFIAGLLALLDENEQDLKVCT